MSSIREPEELDSEFQAFEQPVNEKPYAKTNGRFNEKDLANPIPEVSFEPPPMMGPPPIVEEKISQPKKEPTAPFNQEMTDMKEKEKLDAAKHVTEVVLSGYEMLHQFANSKIKFNERKLKKLEMEGEIDFQVRIPIDSHGNTMAAGEFIQEFNAQNGEILKVSDEFKDEVRPVLTKVLAKRGVGMTDEQRLLWLFGKDIGMKATLIFSAMSQRKEIIELLKEQTASNRPATTQTTYTPQTNETKEEVTFVEAEDLGNGGLDTKVTPPPPRSGGPAPTAKEMVDAALNPEQ